MPLVGVGPVFPWGVGSQECLENFTGILECIDSCTCSCVYEGENVNCTAEPVLK